MPRVAPATTRQASGASSALNDAGSGPAGNAAAKQGVKRRCTPSLGCCFVGFFLRSFASYGGRCCCSRLVSGRSRQAPTHGPAGTAGALGRSVAPSCWFHAGQAHVLGCANRVTQNRARARGINREASDEPSAQARARAAGDTYLLLRVRGNKAKRTNDERAYPHHSRRSPPPAALAWLHAIVRLFPCCGLFWSIQDTLAPPGALFVRSYFWVGAATVSAVLIGSKTNKN